MNHLGIYCRNWARSSTITLFRGVWVNSHLHPANVKMTMVLAIVFGGDSELQLGLLHLFIPDNLCRNLTFFLLWKCSVTHQLHVYFIILHIFPLNVSLLKKMKFITQMPYCLLMDGLSKAGHLDEASAVFKEMQDKNVKSSTYHHLEFWPSPDFPSVDDLYIFYPQMVMPIVSWFQHSAEVGILKRQKT